MILRSAERPLCAGVDFLESTNPLLPVSRVSTSEPPALNSCREIYRQRIRQDDSPLRASDPKLRLRLAMDGTTPDLNRSSSLATSLLAPINLVTYFTRAAYKPTITCKPRNTPQRHAPRPKLPARNTTRLQDVLQLVRQPLPPCIRQ